MTSTPAPPASDEPDYTIGHGRWPGLAIAAVWLVFLVPVLGAGWDRGAVRGALATVLVAGFVAGYLGALALVRGPLGPPPGASGRRIVGAGAVGAMAVLAVGMCLTAGEAGLSAVPYLSVSAVFVLGTRLNWFVGGLIALAGFAAGAVMPGWTLQPGVLFGGLLATLAGWGARRMIRIRAENTKLLMDQQRDRFARDLHDILGHSLTVITVKAELAQRLIDVNVDRARTEIADLERLSRDALADVRRAVAGYREITLPGEIANARHALDAAGIEAVLPQSTEDVPTPLRELFAWAVREGVTNVIRHSGAQTCTVELAHDLVSVRDDGRGCPAAIGGHGLVGLRERAASAGARVSTRNLDPGFALEVHHV